MNQESNKILEEIKNLIENNDIVLFMKGCKESPMCGFSGFVSQVLQKLNVDFKDVDVISQGEFREAIKVYSSWPTIPQLYIKGEFIGGADIVRELYTSGELQKKLGIAN